MIIPELALIILGQTIAGSVILVMVMTKVKVWLGLGGTIVTILTFVLGGVMGAVGFFLHILAANITLVWAILQGLVSAWVATGGYDLLFGKKK